MEPNSKPNENTGSKTVHIISGTTREKGAPSRGNP